jgi:hypothetical protein
VIKCIVSRAATKMYRRALAAAFDGWALKAENVKRLRHLAGVAVSRRARHSQGCFLAAWWGCYLFVF